MFISLAYAAMVVCFVTGIDKLTSACERLPIICFLVLYPVIVLFIFTWLFVCHHTKFYAPSDYRSDEFFAAMSGKEIKSKSEQESAEIREDLIREYEVSGSVGEKEKVDMLPSIKEIVKTAEKAEKMAVEYLGRILRINFKMNVRSRLNGCRYEFDAVGDGQYGKYIIECKYGYFQPTKPILSRIEKRLNRLSADLDETRITYRLFLIYVLKECSQENKDSIRSFFKDKCPGVSVYVLEYDDLKSRLQNNED